MNTVFEDILSKIEKDERHTFDGCINKRFVREIILQTERKYNNGHFGCNSNGEHEKCNDCPLTNCNIRNKIWFGYEKLANNTEFQSDNDWIPCSSGRFPNKYVAVDVTIKQETDDGGYEYLVKESWYQEGDSWNMQKNRHNPVVIAWKPKAKPYEDR